MVYMSNIDTPDKIMAAKETDQRQTSTNGDEMSQVKSEKLGFTVYYKASENNPGQPLNIVVINEENERLRFLEHHLKNTRLSCQDEVVTFTLIREAERVFEETKEDKKTERTNKIEESCKTLCKFFMKGTCRFGDQCFNSHDLVPTGCSGDVEFSQNVSDPTDEKGNGSLDIKPQSKQTKNKKITDSEKAKKKVPMKTATDVINRIQWDEKLHPADFTVGYLDRFLGVIENSYSSFDWEDVTSVDQSILAIPRHRIQYFKYRDEIVWDKNKRLDCVFGSTGSRQTILDIIEKTGHEEKC